MIVIAHIHKSSHYVRFGQSQFEVPVSRLTDHSVIGDWSIRVDQRMIECWRVDAPRKYLSGFRFTAATHPSQQTKID